MINDFGAAHRGIRARLGEEAGGTSVVASAFCIATPIFLASADLGLGVATFCGCLAVMKTLVWLR